MPSDSRPKDPEGRHFGRSTNGRWIGKVRAITRSSLDGRTKARRQFDQIAEAIASDLGGVEQLSTVEKHLVEAFAGVAIAVNDITARLLLGDEEFDVVEQAQAISTMVRVASRIGIKRVARNVTPSLSKYIERDAEVDVALSAES
jgi:hypothetical protein